jgi:peptidyl-prolyl cis-trans isomerase D
VLLKVAKVKPAKTPGLAELTPQLSERMKLDRGLEKVEAVYAEVEDMRAGQTKFEDIATKTKSKFVVIPAVNAEGFDRDGKTVEIPGKDDVLKAVFSSDVGVENDALNIDDGYVWYDVRGIIPSALRPIADVKAQVTKDWKAEKLRNLAAEKAKAFVEKGKAGTTIEALAETVAAPIERAEGLKRTQPTGTLDGLATLAIFGQPEKGFAYSVDPNGTTARVMQVSKVTVPPLNLVSADTKSAKDQITASLTSDFAEAFSKANQDSLGATIDEALWKQISAAPTP